MHEAPAIFDFLQHLEKFFDENHPFFSRKQTAVEIVMLSEWIDETERFLG